MIKIDALNVRQAYAHGMTLLRQQGLREESRAGPVLALPCPVVTTYANPCERVLVDPLRDANPFFHVAEALWMLAGRRDAAFLDRYVSDFGKRFAEDQHFVDSKPEWPYIHDAYGHRWRRHFGYDQLGVIIKRLRENRQDRQCVLQMWDAMLDDERRGAVGGANDLRAKDLRTRPCNTHAYFRVRTEIEIVGASEVSGLGGAHQEDTPYLDLTVLCRSNDMVFGGYGANAVHFSILQEYVAAQVGVAVGRMHQFSNNFHAYVDVLDRVWPRTRSVEDGHHGVDIYEADIVPLVAHPETFDDEVRILIGLVEAGHLDHALAPLMPACRNPWVSTVALPLLHAHAQHRVGNHASAAYSAEQIKAGDWRRAAQEWLGRRRVKREAREHA